MNTISPNPLYNCKPEAVQRLLRVLERLGLRGAEPVAMNESGAVYSDDAYRAIDLAAQDPAVAQNFGILYGWVPVNAADLYRSVFEQGGPEMTPEHRVRVLFGRLGINASDPARAVPAVDAAWRAYQKAIWEVMK